MQPPHDADIVQSVLQGNKAAYAILVDRYQSYVFTIISRLVPLREEAEDVSQEVFVKAYLSLAGFKGISKFSTWLYTIAHTTAISHLRKTRLDSVFTNEETMEAHGGAADTHSENHRDIKQAVNHYALLPRRAVCRRDSGHYEPGHQQCKSKTAPCPQKAEGHSSCYLWKREGTIISQLM
jgi:RNA polymerase sigma factor (sigma-70 family)